MKIYELTKILDDFFQINKLAKDMPFSKGLEKKYLEKNIDVNLFFRKEFLKNFHGLMIKNGDLVKKVYGTVFLDRKVLNKIFSKQEKDILIFSHHPMEDETSGAGFIALDKKYLEKMKELNISVYILHTPLDINPKISVTKSLVKKLNLVKCYRFKEEASPKSAIIGELAKPVNFDVFIENLKLILENPKINFIKKFDFVKKIAVIPGGATDLNYIKDSIREGCDTYLAGEYYNKLKLVKGEEERKNFQAEKESLNINLIEGSHYSTEKIIFENEMKLFFKKLKVDYQFIAQENPWY